MNFKGVIGAIIARMKFVVYCWEMFMEQKIQILFRVVLPQVRLPVISRLPIIVRLRQNVNL